MADELRIGIAGVGFMGMVHYLSYQKLSGVRVAAIADPSAEKRAGDWTSIQGNFGPPGEQMDLSGVAAYESLEAMLADDTLDAVDLTLPPAAHADAACQAFAAGKHVFCEKPMALRPDDCDRMQAAAERAGKQLLIGHVLPFFPEYAWALGVIASGEHGAAVGGAFKRVISDPAWLTHYWDAERVGGQMLDLHVHDAHFIRLVFGEPEEVATTGTSRDGLAKHWNTQFRYASGAAVTATSGVIDQPGRPFQHAFEIHLERATLVFDFAVIDGEGAYLCPPTLLTNDGRVERPRPSDGDPMDAFEAELAEVVRCLTTGDDSPTLGAEAAIGAIRLCQAQTESLLTGRPVTLA